VDTPTYISLYSGGGGLDIGFRLAVPGARAVCFVERELTCAALLVDHMQTGQLDDAPLWSDANTFNGRPWRGKVDWVIGGPPCQPFSQAGKRRAADDPRNGWPNTLRLVREIEPRGCFFENVASADLLRYYWWEVKPGLQAMGYQVEEILVEAADAGASHHRKRTFILAIRDGEQGDLLERSQRLLESRGSNKDVGHGGYDTGSREQGIESESRSATSRSRESGEGSLADDHDSGVSSSERGHQREGSERSSSREDGSLSQSRRHGDELGDGHDGLREATREQVRARWNSAVDASRNVGNSDSGGCDQRSGESGSQGRSGGRISATLGSGKVLVDSDSERGRSRETGSQHAADVEPPGQNFYRRGFPPGPDEREGWRQILELRPDLAPAVESSVLRMAHGLAGGLVRNDRIRILGNGVVPQQAALAIASMIGAIE